MIRKVRRFAKKGDKIVITGKVDLENRILGVKQGMEFYITGISFDGNAMLILDKPPYREYISLYQYEYLVLEEYTPTLTEATEDELEEELKNRRQPKYTGDVVCIQESCSHTFKKGVIYRIEKGIPYKLLDYKIKVGMTFGSDILSINDLNERLEGKFIELVK